MQRSPDARGPLHSGIGAGSGWRALAGVALLVVCFAPVTARADVTPVPGGALHAPQPVPEPVRGRVAAPEASPRPRISTVDPGVLYVYETPFAEPRWLRLQRDGDVLWGTIDINGPFGYCARTRVSGWASGDTVTFDVDLTQTPCPCSGVDAALRFIGTIDAQGGITGTWRNNCTPPTGSWTACQSADPPESGVCDPLPDNDPPYPVAQVPAAGALVLAALAFVLVGWSLIGLRRRRGSEGV